MTSQFAIQITFSTVLSLSSADLEQRAVRHLGQEFERVGRSTPAIDQSLSRAARALARQALKAVRPKQRTSCPSARPFRMPRAMIQAREPS